MKRLRRVSDSWTGESFHVTAGEGPVQELEPQASESEDLPKKGNTKTSENEEKKDDSKKTSGKKPKSKATPKKKASGSKDSKAKAKAEPKKSSKKRSKEAVGTPKAAKKPKTTDRTKPKKEYVVCEEAKAIALSTLEECRKTHCTHPGFEVPKPTSGIDFVPYWSRGAVGIKVLRKYMSNKKAQETGKSGGSAKSQMAYFGNACPCCYASYNVAKIYVSRLQLNGLDKGLVVGWRALFIYRILRGTIK